MRLPRLSPSRYRRVTLAATLLLAFIIVTGGAVRLTGSGLGCPDWPTCAENRVVAPWEYHAMIEFANRTVTGLVSVAVIVAVLGSLLRVPRRRDLVWLSLGLVAGVVGQIVLGGLTVLFELWPPLVMGHFLLSMVILANAIVLHHRAGCPEGPARVAASLAVLRLGRLVLVATAMVVVTGTVVTASGPHGGDEHVERLPFSLPDVARIHGISVMALLALVAILLVTVRSTGAPKEVRRAGVMVLAVLVVQAGVGYGQWLTGVPPLLVGLHIVGAAAVWSAAVRLNLALFEHKGLTTKDATPAVVSQPAAFVAT